MLRAVVVLSYVFDRLLLFHGLEVGAAAAHAAHTSHTGHTRKRHVDAKCVRRAREKCCG
jgi:hypothetical protein